MEAIKTDASCESGVDGSIKVIVEGGTLPYIYQWSNGVVQSDAYNLSDGSFSVVIIDNNNCIISDSFNLSTTTDCFVIPTVFSPNNDGKNDIWLVQNNDANPIELIQVINENGLIVFETLDLEPWDGTSNGFDVLANVYYYIIKHYNGEFNTGAITLIR
jgi:gliding motility-associated-like protein